MGRGCKSERRGGEMIEEKMNISESGEEQQNTDM